MEFGVLEFVIASAVCYCFQLVPSADGLREPLSSTRQPHMRTPLLMTARIAASRCFRLAYELSANKAIKE